MRTLVEQTRDNVAEWLKQDELARHYTQTMLN